jgi:hypothetical protein
MSTPPTHAQAVDAEPTFTCWTQALPPPHNTFAPPTLRYNKRAPQRHQHLQPTSLAANTPILIILSSRTIRRSCVITVVQFINVNFPLVARLEKGLGRF